MIKTELTIEFTTYDGQLTSRPPVFDPDADVPLPRHELDGHHHTLMLIPAGQDKPLNMAFMFFYLSHSGSFEWCSKYSAKELSDESGLEVSLDEAGYISFPLQIGDRWALWPDLQPDPH